LITELLETENISEPSSKKTKIDDFILNASISLG
jgi:hypothetical protein